MITILSGLYTLSTSLRKPDPKQNMVPDILESVQIILESSTMKLNHVELYIHKSKEATTNLI